MKQLRFTVWAAVLAAIAAVGAKAEPINEATARMAAEHFLQTSKMAARTLPDRSVESIAQRGNLWVVRLAPSGHILLSGSDRATPIIGFSQNDFSEGEEDSAERAMLDAADEAVAAAEADETKGRHSRWDSLLAELGVSKVARRLLGDSGTDIYIAPFVDSKYNQNQPWNDLTPVTSKDSDYIWRGRSCAGCVSIADAAIYRELEWPKYPARTETITHNLRGENFAIRFDGSAPFDWSKMSDTYSYSGDMRGKTGAEEDKRYEIGRYVLWLNQSASMSYNVGESTSTKYTAAHGSERDWYTIGQSMSASDEAVEAKVTGILEAGIPVFVGIGGHAVVADGWQKEDSDSQVHLVYGYGGNASDKFYSLETGPAQYFWIDHYPRAKPQLDPIPRVVGNSVTLSWSFPDCYADKNYMFYIKGKRRTSNEVIDWTADFSDATTGSAYPANIWYATNNYGATSISLDAEDLTYGFYQFSTPLTITSDSELSFKIRGGAHKSGDACKDNVVIEICGEDGNWHELFVPEINWAYWPGTWKENTKSLAEYAGQTVQLRIYKRHATYNGHVVIGDFKVTDVIPLTGENVFEMALATDRSKTINGLANGSDYYFSVTPYVYGALVDGEPSDAKITTCSSSASSEMPALFTSIQYAANGGAAEDLVDGYLANGSIGSSTLYVTTPTTVTSLTATPSHVELVKDENVHVAKVSEGNWEITFDPVIPANRDRQRMILTLHATDTNGTTVHRDVVMRMTEDKIVIGEGETWGVGDVTLTRSLVLDGGTVTANGTLAINQNGISSFTVTDNSTINGTGSLCISNSNATIAFSDSAQLTNGVDIESDNEETLTLTGTGTFVQGAGTTIKVYDMSVGEHVLLNLTLSDASSTTDAIVQFGYATPSISEWKVMITAPAELAAGTYPLISAPTYLGMPTIYLPTLNLACKAEIQNNNTLCLVVSEGEKYTTTTDYPVSYSWMETYVPGMPESYMETFAKMDVASGYKYWQCYVLGLDPTDANSTFTATLIMNGNTPIITYSPTNETLVADATMPIEYVLQGNESAEGGEWVDTSFKSPGANFVRFRVDVRWTNGETKHIYSNEVEKPVEPGYVGPAPIAAWKNDFSAEALSRFSANGVSITDWQQTHGANNNSVTIDRDNTGLLVDFTGSKGYVTVLVKYTGLTASTTAKRVLFATTPNSNHTRDRCGIRLLTNGQVQGLWNNSTTANNDADYGTATGSVPSSGTFAFIYDKDKSGTSVYVAESGEQLPNTALWSNAALKSGNIYGFAVGGMCRDASASGVEAAKGMTITELVVFTNILTVAEMNSYLGPQEQTTNTDYAVPYSWFAEYGVAEDNVEATATNTAANGTYSWWECYVLGLDPTNTTSKFTVSIRMDGETPIVEYSPTNTVLEDIEYVLQGKPLLMNDWQDVSFEDPGDTNRFFRIKVKW